MGFEPDIPQREAGAEFGTIKDWMRRARTQYKQWHRPGEGKASDPLLRRLYPAAQEYLERPEDPLLTQMGKTALELLEQGPSPLTQAITGFGLENLEAGPSELSEALTGYGIEALTRGPSEWLESAQGQAIEDLARRGLLTPEQIGDATQLARRTSASLGNLYGNQNIARELLGREDVRRANEDRARAFGVTTEQLAQADLLNRFKIGAGAEEAERAEEESRFNIAAGAQGAERQDLLTRIGLGTQVLGDKLRDQMARFQIPQDVLKTGVSTYTALTNPFIGFLSDLFSSNQNAAAAEEIGAANKNAALLGSGIESIGNVVGGVAGMSDEQLKTDVAYTGRHTPEGIPIKTFRYKYDPQRFEGVMAGDVERIKPEAVGRTAEGLRFVRFDQIEAPMRFAEEDSALLMEVT